MTYVVLYNRDENVLGGDARDAIAARGNLEALEAIEAALSVLGPVVAIETGDGDPAALARALRETAPRAVFNLAEAVRGVPALEPAVPALLELLGIPYTGNGPFTLALCLDKPRTKALLRGYGLPTPPWRVLEDPHGGSLEGLELPLIVKPSAMDASHGIDPDSVVHDEAAARRRAALVIERFGQPALVEQFVDGRELNVSIVDDPPAVLPASEIDFRLPPGAPRIVGYEAKWIEGTEAHAGTPVVCPATLEPELEAAVRDLALRAFRAVGARDYARVDLRVDREGRPFILEVNPNPDVSPAAGLARAARAAGWRYDDLVRRFVRLAEERGSARARPGTVPAPAALCERR